jgi:hypothetical protein
MTCKICGKLNETWWYEYEGYNEEELRRNVVRSPACPCHHKTICPRCHYQWFCHKFKLINYNYLGIVCKYETEHGIAYQKRVVD